MDMNRMCRTCQSVNGLMNVLNKENEGLVVMLQRLACIFIKEDDLLPKLICYSCARSLRMASAFIVQCQKTDIILRAKLDGNMSPKETLHKPTSEFEIDGVSLKAEPIDGVLSLEETLQKSTDDSDNGATVKIEPIEEDMSSRQMLQKSPDLSDDDSVSVKIEPIEGIIVKSTLDQASARIIVIDDYPEGNGIKQQFIDDQEKEFNVNDIIEVDEDFVEETSEMNFANYFECTKEVMTHDTTMPLKPDTDQQPITKPSTRSKGASSTKVKTKTRIKKIKTYICPVCSDPFTDYSEFMAHKKTHYPYRNACKICGRQFTTSNGLKSHLDVHKDKIACHLCGTLCSNHSNLSRHMRHYHDKIRPHSCEVCGRQFSQRTTLRDHVATHTEERNFACDMCDKRFKTSTALYVHKRHHDPDFIKRKYDYIKGQVYICEHCGKKSNSYHCFIAHRAIHSNVKEFECEVCHKRFHLKTSLKSHMLSHTGERPYACDVCGKAFRQAAHLRTHKLLIHDPEAARRYTCKFCGKSFTGSGTLKVHERIHTGEKPYECDVCPSRFIDMNGLKRHRRKIHSIDTPKTRTVVLDEDKIMLHKSNIGKLRKDQGHIVGDENVIDSCNED